MRIVINDFIRADGIPAKEFVKIETPDYVEVLPFDPTTGEVVLICQFHWGVGAPLIKLPAGKVKSGQSPLQAARSELREEAGVEGEIFPLKTVYDIPMWYSATAHHFMAFVDANEYAAQRLDEDEEIAVIVAPIGEVYKAIMERDPLTSDTALNLAVLFAIQSGFIDPKFLTPQEVTPTQE